MPINFSGFLKEYAYKATTQPISLWQKQPPSNWTANHGKPILFIYGFDGYWSQAIPIAKTFLPLGYSVYCPTQIANNAIPLNTSVSLVKKYISDQQLKDFIIIGHSKGGLIAHQLLSDHQISPLIRQVITISTPYAGLPELYYQIPHIREYIPPVINALSSSSLAKIANIYTEFDTTLIPANNMTLPGANNLVFPGTGHAWILQDPKFLSLIQGFILL